jgi:hypothetical protein
MSETYSKVISELEKNQAELLVTISTLQKMSIPVSDELLEKSCQNSDVLAVLDVLSKSSAEINSKISKLETRMKGEN